MTKIVIVTALYPPEPVVSANLSFDLALLLTEKGYHVTVLCPYPSRPLGFDFGKFSFKNEVSLEYSNSGTIVRLPSFRSPKSNLLGRFFESLSFGRNVEKYITKNLKDTGVVYANTWPILGQWLLAKRLKKLKIPLLLHIQDIYPESLLIKLPRLVRIVLAKPLIYIDLHTANLAQRLIVVSDNMRLFYQNQRKIKKEKILLVNNWQDEKEFITSKFEISSNQYRNKFVFMYLGNIGPVAGVDLLIRAFYSAQINDAQLLIVGNGSDKEKCQALVVTLNLNNVEFLEIPEGQKAVAEIQSIANVLLLPVKKNAAMTSIPSKLIAYMFSAKPIISTVDLGSDTSKAILESNCGWVGEPEDVNWLSNTMTDVANLPENQLNEIGRNGYKFGLNNYSKGINCQKLAKAIIEISNEN